MKTHQAYGSQFNNLIDQNNNEVHYNVRVNRDEFERMKEMGFADTGTYDYNGPFSVENKTRFPDARQHGWFYRRGCDGS